MEIRCVYTIPVSFAYSRRIGPLQRETVHFALVTGMGLGYAYNSASCWVEKDY
jgi:hypothetical protein